MSVQVKEVIARTILTPQKVGSLATAFDYSLNPYAGCAFACSYCYVPKFPNGEHEASEWGQWVNVKTNAAELLADERHKIYGSRIFFSSATDPYQYIELKYRLSRKCLSVLQCYQPAKVTMHTRSHLILQDLKLLQSFGDRLQVGVSITTDCDDIRKEFEPNAPSIGRRLELIKALSQAGITVHASLSPLLPCNPDRLISLITPYVKKIWIDEMRSLEVNTKPALLQKHAVFFDKLNYAATIEYIQSAFSYYTGYRAPVTNNHRTIAAYKAPRERARRETYRQCKLF
jgi:DNA repair photolyase